MEQIKPKEITLKSIDGETKVFMLSRIPAIKARKMITQYPITAAPKIGDYEVNEKLMIELLSFVSVVTDDGSKLPLSTTSMIDNHVSDGEMLMKLEYAMMDYNTGFFKIGKISKGLDGFAGKVTQLVTQILTNSQVSSSANVKLQSKN